MLSAVGLGEPTVSTRGARGLEVLIRGRPINLIYWTAAIHSCAANESHESRGGADRIN